MRYLHCWALALALCAAAPAHAHSLSPSLLQAEEHEDHRVDFVWTTPAKVPAGTRVQPLVPQACTPDIAPDIERHRAQFVVRWTMRCGAALTGQAFGVSGLSVSRGNALLRVALADGRRYETVLTADRSTYVIPERAGAPAVARDYLRLGVEHILTGWDHLAFVLGLLLVVSGRWPLIATITAFTLGHSITLALATFGRVHVPQAWAEAGIAFSILVVAVEAMRGDGKSSLLRRSPWIAAALFGLIHGLGFAGALTEVGLPQQAIALALLFFNLGIEAGQLVFIIGVIGLSRWAAHVWQAGIPSWARWAPHYAIGSLASFWLFQRLAGLV